LTAQPIAVYRIIQGDYNGEENTTNHKALSKEKLSQKYQKGGKRIRNSVPDILYDKYKWHPITL
jgi:hypothetical protein